MNIMEMLGFGKNGAAKNQNANQNAAPTRKLGLIDSTPREEGKSRIYNIIILDESGSMQSIYRQALNGVNETINSIRQTQKEDPTTQQILILVTFDSNANREPVRAIINC
ncbi:MAG: hypothetical protein MJZ16_00470 [Bacteroidales bacterium]|nr:hypothetical protein [Bacteroidales bacterium]